MGVRPEPDVSPTTPSEATFDDFVRQFEPRLWRALVPLAGPEIAQEAANEALIYAWQHWDRVAHLENTEGYLYRVAQRLARRARQRPLPLLLPPVDRRELPTVEPALVPALLSLSEMQRTVVWLVEGCEEPLTATATLLGVSVSTIRNHHQRGMKKLRAALKVDTDA
jgi:DNA-directed RNA polymerase specialized sigma24 family protein